MPRKFLRLRRQTTPFRFLSTLIHTLISPSPRKREKSTTHGTQHHVRIRVSPQNQRERHELMSFSTETIDKRQELEEKGLEREGRAVQSNWLRIDLPVLNLNKRQLVADKALRSQQTPSYRLAVSVAIFLLGELEGQAGKVFATGVETRS